LKRTSIAAFFIIILSISFALTIPLPNVKAVGVQIISVTPISHIGKVGETVSVTGTINTTNGLYQIWFGQNKVKEANATVNIVNATFPVPQLPGGNYTLTLHDFSFAVNTTTWFYIDTAYYIEAKTPSPPKQLQQGSTVEIWVNVTGGRPNTVYTANVTVKVPAPAGTTYWTLTTLTNTTNTGEGHNTAIVYPSNFSGTPHANYTGTYTAAFNKTLATDTFYVGLTNSTEYHRHQLVDIKASGYKSNENVTVKINFGVKILQSNNATATTGGLIASNWTVPTNATIGTYTVNITSKSPSPTTKNPPDVQNFIVPGFNINMTTKSLAGQIVPSVTVRIFEDGESILNVTSTSNGLAQMGLETGNYTGRAFYKGEKVGERLITVTEAVSLDYYCNLTSLKVSVLAKFAGTDVAVPDVKVYLTPENSTFFTNTTGIAVLNPLLPNHTYALNVSRYGVSFNVTSFPTLFINGNTVAWYNVTVVCPTLTMRINVTKANNEPIANVEVKAQESMGGLLYEGNTTAEGITVFNGAFGKYQIEVFDADGIKLNETSLNLFQNQNVTIICKLYGLTISFRIVDYFGQPLSNVNVTLQRENVALRSDRTHANGIATFSNITGGSLQVSIHIFNQMQPDMTEVFNVENSATIDIKVDAYVILAGFLINTAILTATIIIVATALLFLLVEVYRRRRFKQQKGPKVESK
jgi:hypothetical protein